MSERTLYLLSASLMKSEPGRSVHTLMQGYRVCDSEDKAKGSFVTWVMKEKPDFSIAQLLCMPVPKEHVESVLKEDAA